MKKLIGKKIFTILGSKVLLILKILVTQSQMSAVIEFRFLCGGPDGRSMQDLLSLCICGISSGSSLVASVPV